jgi:hypothetical protein
MNRRRNSCRQLVLFTMHACLFAVSATSAVRAQRSPDERVFPRSKAEVEKALKAIQGTLAGHLPVLEGFAKPGEYPLDRYQRGYYQTTVQVSATASGGSLVRVSAKVTAWYSDAVTSRSGYQLLTSNGRLEADLLDQLSEQLVAEQPAEKHAAAGDSANTVSDSLGKAESVAAAQPSVPAAKAEPLIDAPEVAKSEFSSPPTLAAEERSSAHDATSPNIEKKDSALQAEAKSLEEILKNQAHPDNLVAVKKSGTAVVESPSLTAKPLFLASMHDEFEMLDFNRDWVRVRISGLSRGWIWRNAVEMPEGIPDNDLQPAPAPAAAADLFHVVREENAQFPGDWGLLRGKNVKILSVQNIDEKAKQAGSKERLEYAKFLLAKNYTEVAQKSPDLAGIVLIFDSADGGMIATTMSALQQWKAGTMSDAALWHQCFFDPPENLDSASPPRSQ